MDALNTKKISKNVQETSVTLKIAFQVEIPNQKFDLEILISRSNMLFRMIKLCFLYSTYNITPETIPK